MMLTNEEAICLFGVIALFLIVMAVLSSVGCCGDCQCNKKKCKECGSDMERMSRNITRYSHEGDSPVSDIEIYYYCESCGNEEY